VKISMIVQLCPIRGFLDFLCRYLYGSPNMGPKWFLDMFGDRYTGDGGTDRREILHDGKYRWRTGLLHLEGGTIRDPENPKNLAL